MKINKILVTIFSIVFLSFSEGVFAGEMAESFGFTMPNMVTLQHGGSKIDITLEMHYKDGIKEHEYPDFLRLQKFVDDYLKNRADKNKYWEVINKDMIRSMVMELKLTMIKQIDTTITVHSGSGKILFTRSSKIVYTPSEIDKN